jgi:hypothetical protein
MQGSSVAKAMVVRGANFRVRGGRMKDVATVLPAINDKEMLA